MAEFTDRKFSFTSTALAPDAFTVVQFQGEEGLFAPYRFEVLLAAADPAIDLGQVIHHPARFTIHRQDGDDVVFNGIVVSFQQLQAVDTVVFYRAVLAPRLWWLSLTHHNQVFLDLSIPDIIKAALQDGGLTALDFEFRLQGDYAKRDYVCQYGESHLDFVSRWMAHEGIYYHFEQGTDAEKLVITDTALAHADNPRGQTLRFSPPSALTDAHREEIVQSLTCRASLVPQAVLLKDYNYRRPSVELSGRAEVDAQGRGEVYFYGEHFRTPEDGNRLAAIRAQALLCSREQYQGQSTVPYVQPGYTFTLAGHYRPSFDQHYLTIGMSHEGSQTGYLTAGIQKALAEREARVYYQNRFTAIPAGVQFRPLKNGDGPRIDGVISARIDASGSGQFAELDDQGRYKVRLPFDLSEKKGGKASAWVRMASPYAGADHGMHFPLHRDTEVLLTFIDGDPDRPIIAGAAPNPENPSPVTSANATKSIITTASGNKIHMEDRAGSERILMHVPRQSSFIRIGAHNDPPLSGDTPSATPEPTAQPTETPTPTEEPESSAETASDEQPEEQAFPGDLFPPPIPPYREGSDGPPPFTPVPTGTPWPTGPTPPTPTVTEPIPTPTDTGPTPTPTDTGPTPTPTDTGPTPTPTDTGPTPTPTDTGPTPTPTDTGPTPTPTDTGPTPTPTDTGPTPTPTDTGPTPTPTDTGPTPTPTDTGPTPTPTDTGPTPTPTDTGPTPTPTDTGPTPTPTDTGPTPTPTDTGPTPTPTDTGPTPTPTDTGPTPTPTDTGPTPTPTDTGPTPTPTDTGPTPTPTDTGPTPTPTDTGPTPTPTDTGPTPTPTDTGPTPTPTDTGPTPTPTDTEPTPTPTDTGPTPTPTDTGPTPTPTDTGPTPTPTDTGPTPTPTDTGPTPSPTDTGPTPTPTDTEPTPTPTDTDPTPTPTDTGPTPSPTDTGPTPTPTDTGPTPTPTDTGPTPTPTDTGPTPTPTDTGPTPTPTDTGPTPTPTDTGPTPTPTDTGPTPTPTDTGPTPTPTDTGPTPTPTDTGPTPTPTDTGPTPTPTDTGPTPTPTDTGPTPSPTDTGPTPTPTDTGPTPTPTDTGPTPTPTDTGPTPTETEPEPSETEPEPSEEKDKEDDDWSFSTESGIAKKTKGWLEIEAQLKNEVILGEASDSVLGAARIEIALIAAIASEILGTWDINREKWAFFNGKTEIEAEHLQAHITRKVLRLLDQKVSGQTQIAIQNVQKSFAEELKATENLINMAVETTRASIEQTESFAEKLETLGTSLGAITEAVKVVGTRLGEAGTSLQDAGQSLETAGTAIEEDGTFVGIHALNCIETAGTAIEQAGVILKG